uniref:Secreted protein n=2 Tax=Anas platyrhynchos TaxID=8839 RepID=A0A493TM53_ANAPP
MGRALLVCLSLLWVCVKGCCFHLVLLGRNLQLRLAGSCGVTPPQLHASLLGALARACSRCFRNPSSAPLEDGLSLCLPIALTSYWLQHSPSGAH